MRSSATDAEAAFALHCLALPCFKQTKNVCLPVCLFVLFVVLFLSLSRYWCSEQEGAAKCICIDTCACGRLRVCNRLPFVWLLAWFIGWVVARLFAFRRGRLFHLTRILPLQALVSMFFHSEGTGLLQFFCTADRTCAP